MQNEAQLKEFLLAVQDTCSGFADKKNYEASTEAKKSIGVHVPHAIGEIVVKCGEFLKNRKKLIAVKIAGWAFVLWLEAED